MKMSRSEMKTIATVNPAKMEKPFEYSLLNKIGFLLLALSMSVFFAGTLIYVFDDLLFQEIDKNLVDKAIMVWLGVNTVIALTCFGFNRKVWREILKNF